MKLIKPLVILFLLTVSSNLWAAKKVRIKPFILVSNDSGEISQLIDSTKLKLTENKFTIVGEYEPTENIHIIATTNDDLLKAAAKTDFGGFGAVIRVAITKVGDKVQLSYVNPIYMAGLYRMADLKPVADQLSQALGEGSSFGSKKGIRKKYLKKYHYMMFMPYFDDQDKIASFSSHEEALKTINDNLSKGKNGMSKVFEVAIPGKQQVLFGVGITQGDGADKLIMDTIDKKTLKHSAHLPYGLLVSDHKVYALAGKFRIATSFPDLGMFQFNDISDAPDAIVDSFKALTKK